MNKVSHPGTALLDVFVKSGSGIVEAAEVMGVPSYELARIINFKAPITARLAVLLERTFPVVNAESWMLAQAAFDLSEARQDVEAEQNWELAQNFCKGMTDAEMPADLRALVQEAGEHLEARTAARFVGEALARGYAR